MRTRSQVFQGTRPGEVSKGRHCCLADGGDGVNSKPARFNPKRAAPKILQDLIATRPIKEGRGVAKYSFGRPPTVERSKSRSLTSVASCVMRPKGGRRVGLEMVRFGMTVGGRKESLLKSCRLGVRSRSKSRPRKAGATKSGRTYESDPATFGRSDKLKTNDRTARNS